MAGLRPAIGRPSAGLRPAKGRPSAGLRPAFGRPSAGLRPAVGSPIKVQGICFQKSDFFKKSRDPSKKTRAEISMTDPC